MLLKTAFAQLCLRRGAGRDQALRNRGAIAGAPRSELEHGSRAQPTCRRTAASAFLFTPSTRHVLMRKGDAERDTEARRLAIARRSRRACGSTGDVAEELDCIDSLSNQTMRSDAARREGHHGSGARCGLPSSVATSCENASARASRQGGASHHDRARAERKLRVECPTRVGLDSPATHGHGLALEVASPRAGYQTHRSSVSSRRAGLHRRAELPTMSCMRA